MLESFKLKANELRRFLKIHISLPNDYNENNKKYPLILVLDGQLLFNFIGEETKVFNTKEMIKDIEDEVILACLHSPSIKEWRLSELNPYYNGSLKDVDKVLSLIYYEYIKNTLIPMLKERYRFDNVYLAGFNDSCIASLYMLYHYDIFKGAALFDINLNECSEKFNTDLDYKFTCKKSIYLFHGGINTTTRDDDTFYRLCQKFESYKTEYLKYDYDSNLDNSYSSIEKKFSDGIKHIIQNK